LLTGPMVTVIVGLGRKPYKLHRDLLSERSSYFEAALLGHFQEAENQQIEFPEDDVTTFDLFVRWLYNKGPMHHEMSTTTNLKHYISLMCFAQRILLTTLHNDCIDAVRKHFQREARSIPGSCPGIYSQILHALPLVYDAVPKQKQLRFCFCLELALIISERSQKGLAEGCWMDQDLSRILQEGGDLASDFPPLLAYCNREPHSRPSLNQLSILYSRFDWLFHVHAPDSTISQMSSYDDRSTLGIEAAAKIFGKADWSEKENDKYQQMKTAMQYRLAVLDKQ
ncbi:MAG: hypothetical protein Q9169_008386, partial [Polycauliona sp. 2 TL-2023]